MFLNYIKITLRNLYKEKMYAAINISGLSIGIACCIIIGLYLRSELTYDRHNLKYERIYQLMADIQSSDKDVTIAETPWDIGSSIVKDYPEVEAYVRLRNMDRTLLRYEEKNMYWDNIFTADEKVFEVFTHNIIYGDPGTALSEPYSMAVCESFSKKYFVDTNPVGKVITSDLAQYKITLVFADLPENSHLRYDALVSYNRSQDGEAQPYNMLLTRGDNFSTYLLMPEGYSAESFHNPDEPSSIRHSKEKLAEGGIGIRPWLRPLANIHFESDPKIRLYVYGMSAVAIFILVIACINYVNLATARSMKRNREVGIRKVLGSTKLQLIVQFLGESIVFAFIALIIGLILVEIATAFTQVNELLGRQELMNFGDEPLLLLWPLALVLFIGLISGIYPAFYLSSAPPIYALSGTNQSRKKGFIVRHILVLIQFIISITVISSTILMALQMRYVAEKPLGFSKDNMIVVTIRNTDVIKKVPVLKQELLKDSRILGMAEAINMVTGSAFGNYYTAENNDGVMEEQKMPMTQMTIGEGFIDVMGIELIAGKNISHKLWSGSNPHVLVNETMVNKMGWKEPVGKHLQLGKAVFTVAGVVKDFHFYSLHQEVGPLVIWTWGVNFYSSWIPRLLIVKISGEEIQGTLNHIRSVFEEFDPEHPFEYRFLDDELNDFYKSEQRLMKLTGIFSGICILISCLGLFGLAAFTTEQRTKEIGVRKVLGSSTLQIIVMLSRGILLIVLAASVIASLIAYFIIDEWLTNFAYHIGINPLVFVISSALAMAIAFGTVALQAFKTANENPVKALRYE